MNESALGVDIGGVIIDRVDGAADTSFFGDNYLSTPAVAGAFEALRTLVDGRFGQRVYLVSKAGPRVQAKTLRWLDHLDFFNRTGIGRDGIHFCRERQGKAKLCEALRITHFVDDRLEVLGYLTTVSGLYLFRPDPDEVRNHAQFLARVLQVQEWEEISRELLNADWSGINR